MDASKSGRCLITARADENEKARALAEQAVRQTYGRLLALLAARSGNLTTAEDALSEAFTRALESWPKSGVPASPEAWLLTTARRILVDRGRRNQTAAERERELVLLLEEGATIMEQHVEIPDERLKLLFVCTHPDIDPSLQTPLMLQTVLGLDAASIANAFLVRPSTMSQRLVRLKKRMKHSNIPFDIPGRDQWPARLGAVLQAIYGAYNAGWDDHSDASLSEEALFLADLTGALLPFEAEAKGLMSLLLHCEARRAARRNQRGQYVPLDQQDITLWNHKQISRAERLLEDALRLDAIGRFQLEAALQSAHAARRVTGETDWAAIANIYDRLISISPTIGAKTGRAAAIGNAETPQAGLAALADLPHTLVAEYQPYWAIRAHLENQSGDRDAARESYGRAIGLASSAAVREYLLTQADALD